MLPPVGAHRLRRLEVDRHSHWRRRDAKPVHPRLVHIVDAVRGQAQRCNLMLQQVIEGLDAFSRCCIGLRNRALVRALHGESG
jgi:hypothetical protein